MFLNLKNNFDLRMRKEGRIYSSLAIENNQLTKDQIKDVINGKHVYGSEKDILEGKNAYNAYKKVFDYNPYNVDDFLKTHNLLTKDLIKESGKFRSNDVGVFDSNKNVIHLGARPSYIYDLISDLFYWRETDQCHTLIKSAVIHFEIEIIHPFQDGNGRMGRLWQNLILSKYDKSFKWIPIETIIYKNQKKYYDLLAYCGKKMILQNS